MITKPERDRSDKPVTHHAESSVQRSRGRAAGWKQSTKLNDRASLISASRRIWKSLRSGYFGYQAEKIQTRLCGSLLASVRSNSAATNGLLVLQKMTKQIPSRRLPPPASRRTMDKPEEASRAQASQNENGSGLLVQKRKRNTSVVKKDSMHHETRP